MPFSLDLQPACLFLSLSFGKENHARIHIPSVQLNFPPLNSLYTCLYRKEEKSPPLKNYLFVWLHWVLVVACGIFGAFQVVLVIKNPSVNAGDARDVSWIPGSGRSPGGGNGNSLQYSYLENSTDRGVWQASVHGVIRSCWTRLSTHTRTTWDLEPGPAALAYQGNP